MTGSDISWETPRGAFNLRAAAVITLGHRILLCNVASAEHWFLPGGRVRIGELAHLALARELAEELGHQFPVSQLWLIVENIYHDGAPQHEIGLYYRVPWPAGVPENELEGGSEPGHLFQWVPVSELGSLHFLPAGLVPVLQDPGDGLRHVLLDRTR